MSYRKLPVKDSSKTCISKQKTTTRNLISTQKMSCKHNEDLSHLQQPSWHASKYKVQEIHLVEFMYPVFSCMQGESYHSQLRSLLLVCVTSLEC